MENIEEKLKLVKLEIKSEVKKKLDSAIKKIENLEPQMKDCYARIANQQIRLTEMMRKLNTVEGIF